jgi:hypothetical protein
VIAGQVVSRIPGADLHFAPDLAEGAVKVATHAGLLESKGVRETKAHLGAALAAAAISNGWQSVPFPVTAPRCAPLWFHPAP